MEQAMSKDQKKPKMKSELQKNKTKQAEQKPAQKNHTKGHAKEGCPYAKKCGGCRYQNMSYQEQLFSKEKQVRALLSGFGSVKPIVGMEEPFHYRHKVHAVFGYQKGKGVVSGVYKEGTHDIVDVERCLIEQENADNIIRDIKELVRSFKIKTYNEDTGYGLFRHVLIRCGYATGQYMVVLVLASPVLPSKNNFVKALLKKHPEITTVVLNVNDKRTSMVLGEREIVLYGPGYIEDEILGKTFRISASSFYQVNPVQTQKLYKEAIDVCNLTGTETVIDAYCGTGTIGMIAADYAKEVIGVELNQKAVKDAIVNARKNKVKNITFYEADAGKFMVQMAEQGAKADVVIMDPPRSGSDEAFLSSVCKLAPAKIVYISCNPVTQARDIKYLVKHGYVMKQARAFDLFPFTEHVESVALLVKK